MPNAEEQRDECQLASSRARRVSSIHASVPRTRRRRRGYEPTRGEVGSHRRGDSDRAVARKLGRFEAASGGTLFLDEIGEMPLELQAKLLRVLQDGELSRVGGTRTIEIDVRLVAATNRDLARLVEERQFRDDLYYRLNVF